VCSLQDIKPGFSDVFLILGNKHLRSIYSGLLHDPFAPSHKSLAGAMARTCHLFENVSSFAHVHAHFLGTPALVAFCLSRLTGITYSLTAHAHDIYASHIPRIVLENACRRFTCTAGNQQYLLSKYGVSFELVRHGLNTSTCARRTFRPRKPPCQILAVGRLVEKKGLRYLVEACHTLSCSNFPYVCTIIGDGPERRTLERTIDRYRLHRNVIMAGTLPHHDVLARYPTADILVAPSIVAQNGDRDGVPNCILEAMASELPVVATDAGGIPEVIQDNVTGFVVPQKSPEEIARKCVEVWENNPLTCRLAAAARDFVQNEMDPKRWNTALLDLFRQKAASALLNVKA